MLSLEWNVAETTVCIILCRTGEVFTSEVNISMLNLSTYNVIRLCIGMAEVVISQATDLSV